MGGKQSSGGVEVRETSIRILFSYQGKQRKETLYLDNAPLPPTPANVKYARRVAAEIRDKIRTGDFVYADYFPHSPMAKKAASDAKMLHPAMDRWLELLERKASTKKQYTTRINSFWKVKLPNQPIERVKHSDILEALKSGTWKSAKSRNNELSMIRQFFDFARRDRLISENPCDDIERTSHQRKKPDPFSQEEAEQIISALRARYGEQIGNFYEVQFFTGLRTNEGLGLKWPNIDLQKREVLVEGGIVYDEETEATKTSVARTVKLNSRALTAIERQQKLTGKGDYVFAQDGEPLPYQRVTDVRTHWKPTLTLLGIRYRRPYNTRHTYATVMLMAAVNPAFIAKQLGHSLKMLFEVYADWIHGDQDDREMAKVEQALASQVNPKLVQKTDEFLGGKEKATDSSIKSVA
jgi:integrase